MFLKICIAKSTWFLLVLVRQNILWKINNGNTISCKSVLLIINLQIGLRRSRYIVILPNFKTEWMYSKVDKSSKPKPITNLIVINPFVVLVIWI